ncbi:TonB-dependent receptor [Pedobacter nutrimenti]|uniref:SusC/RagA family TonB-linked outer membrane protein n=1 Tax=Pedobacter nutrimenti TaxID=1241337 RepID=UPI00292E3EA8|nr:TonB-dependent receptor [Pedobacter nutrimenti]
MKKTLQFYTGILFILIQIPLALLAQNTDIQIKGNVRGADGYPLAGASVYITDTKKGTTANENGDFELSVPRGKSITVSYTGYQTKSLVITNNSALSVVLDPDQNVLNDVVVYGYGTTTKKDLTGSIQSISNKELVQSLATNATEALNGRVSGVLVTKSSNRPGTDMSVQIRGTNSFNFSNEPLYVIDGVPSYSGIRHLNSADIESIDILKDASSSAIYGSRGANGVVLITTKGANKKAGFSIEYSATVSAKTPIRIPDMLGNEGNGLEYINYKIALWKKKYGESSLGRTDFFTDDEKRRIKHSEYYDWLREISKVGISNNHTINVSGNSEKTSYSFGFGYTNDAGMVGNENFGRITANLGLEHRFSDRLKIGINNYFSLNKINQGADDALLNAYFLPPVVSPYGADGQYVFEVQPTSSKINPFVQIENNKKINEVRYSNISAFIEGNPIKSLTLKSQLSMQYDNNVYGEWIGKQTQSKMGIIDPEAFRKDGMNLNYVWDNLATYNKTFEKDHKLNLVGLFSLQKETHKGSQMRGKGLPYESDWHAIQTAEEITDVSSYYWESSMISYMARANYTYKDRYLFTATGRVDGSSRLSVDNQWGFMPSMALGWRISEEEFMKKQNTISDLKLRLSWGKSGNNNIDYDVAFSKLNLAKYVFGQKGTNGFGLGDAKGNDKLKWEMTSEWNAGLDLGLFKNRITMTFDAYSRVTKDLIFKQSIAGVNGFNTVLRNIGSTGNKGIELGINTVNLNTSSFNWKTNLTFSLNRNKIKELYGNGKDDLANRWFIGKPINVIYDFEKVGIWQEYERAEALKYGQSPGHIHVRDLNNDGLIDERDYKVLGTPSPDFTGGLTNTFTYKNWDLSIFMYGRYGGLYNDDFTYMFTAWDNEQWNKLNVKYWTPENKSNEYPEIGAQSYYTQVLGKISGSFLKIQNITLGYSLSEKLKKKVGLKQVRIYTAVLNPFTFSAYKGPDPEIIGENVYTQMSLYPLTFNFGLNVSF